MDPPKSRRCDRGQGGRGEASPATLIPLAAATEIKELGWAVFVASTALLLASTMRRAAAGQQVDQGGFAADQQRGGVEHWSGLMHAQG